MTSDPVCLGVVGLGRAFALTAPALAAHPDVTLVAACAPREASRDAFTAAFGGRVYDNVEALCADEAVEAVYISTPHGMHCEHTLIAAAAGKHVLVDKPIAVDLGEARRMVDACAAAGVILITGPSHSFDGPVALAAELIESGAYGRPRLLHAVNHTDFLYRPRRAEELATDLGGGVIFSQAAHQIDVARRLMGARATHVTARTGAWDPARPTEGAYTALIDFECGGVATLTYSGYGRADTDREMGNIDELGRPKTAIYGEARRLLATGVDETALKGARGFTSLADAPHAMIHEHFGPVTIHCDHADLRLTAEAVEISADDNRWSEPAPFRGARWEVCDALYAALRQTAMPVQAGEWGLQTLEICHAILRAAATSTCVPLGDEQGRQS